MKQIKSNRGHSSTAASSQQVTAQVSVPTSIAQSATASQAVLSLADENRILKA